MGAWPWIFEIIGIVSFWIYLNIKVFFLTEDKPCYYSFAELWKGRSSDLGGDKQDGRPYTITGFIILIAIMLIIFLLGI